MPRKKLPDLELAVEEITPEIAKEWLEYNLFNRKLSPRLVSVYVEAILSDEWKLNGEPIIFDYKGKLISGQHRLHAVVEANKSIWSVVVRGAEPEVAYIVDSGRKRNMTDILRMRGEKNVAALGSALNWYWRWKNDAMDRLGETATNSHLLHILGQNPEIRDHLTWGAAVKRRSHAQGLLAILHMMFSEIDEEDANEFFIRFASGENLSAGDPILVLIRWFERIKLETRRPSSVHTAAIVIKAWNAFRDHRSIKALTFKGSESFPEPV